MKNPLENMAFELHGNEIILMVVKAFALFAANVPINVFVKSK